MYLYQLSWLHCLSQHPVITGGSQPLLLSLWFISTTCFTPTHCDHCGETLFQTASASDLLFLPCVCICVYMWCVLQVCQHPNSRMREWGAEALTALIKAGLAYKHDPPLAQNQVGTTVIGLTFKINKNLLKGVVFSLSHPLMLFVWNSGIWQVALWVMTDKKSQISSIWKTEMTEPLSLVAHKHRVYDLHLSETDKGTGAELIWKEDRATVWRLIEQHRAIKRLTVL